MPRLGENISFLYFVMGGPWPCKVFFAFLVSIFLQWRLLMGALCCHFCLFAGAGRSGTGGAQRHGQILSGSGS